MRHLINVTLMVREAKCVKISLACLFIELRANPPVFGKRGLCAEPNYKLLEQLLEQ